MAYVLSKLEERGWMGRDAVVRWLHKWDVTQELVGVVVRWGFLPTSLVLASYRTGTPLWALVAPMG